MAQKKIDTYEVNYSSNTFTRRIWLKGDGVSLGQLIFWANGATLPADTQVSGKYNLNYHREDYQNCIDLLRNEKPVYIFYNGSGPSNENGIRTTEEAVGEGES